MAGERAAGDELTLPYARLEDADFAGRRLTSIDVGPGGRLVRCDFGRIRAAGGALGGGLEPTEFIDCSFDGAHLKNVMPGRATFRGCSFRDVRIFNFHCLEAEFFDCVFSGLLRRVIFDAVPRDNEKLGRSRNGYRGNDFSGARLDDVSFRGGIDLDQQRLPEGPDYLLIREAADTIPRVWHEEIEGWPEQDLKEDIDIPLSVLLDTAERGQRDLFVARSFIVKEVADRKPEAADRVIALLAQRS